MTVIGAHSGTAGMLDPNGGLQGKPTLGWPSRNGNIWSRPVSQLFQRIVR